MKIGNLDFKSPFFLAPLAGVTDAPFRLICSRYGAGAVYSEMISAKGLCYGDKATEKLLKIYDGEAPVAYQIFGSEPEIMKEAVTILRDRKNQIIDINMGCPVPKVVKNGDGSALLRNPELVSKIVRSVVDNAGKPVTVKIRIGWDDNSINAVEIAKRIEESGAKAIGVHGRTRMQFYTGTADRNIIKQVVEAVNIPILGNGDIFDVAGARDMFEYTGCAGIMVARGAMGNPWIFKALIDNIDLTDFDRKVRSIGAGGVEVRTGSTRAGTGKEGTPTPTGIASPVDKINVLKEHYSLCIKEYGEYAGVRMMRKHVGWYIKGIRGASLLRGRINEMDSVEEVYMALDELVQQLS